MNLSVFLPITKVDAVNRTVYGKFTEEQGDRSGEIMDYQTSKPLFQKWSEDMYGASGGKNFGNIRAMHKNVAAGMVCQPLDFDDNGRVIGGLARIVDDDEWRKVEEGVYTGFSVGGRYVKRWTDRDNPRLIRYTAEPSEVSLVDLPCVPGATFQFIKADGAAEERQFSSLVTAPALSDAPVDDTLKKGEIQPKDPPVGTHRPEHADTTGSYTDKRTAGDPGTNPATLSPTKVDPGADNKEEPMGFPHQASPPSNVRKDDGDNGPNGDEVTQVWKAKDGSTHTRKADAVKHNQQLDIDNDVNKASSAAHKAVDELHELLIGKAAGSASAGHADPDKTDPTAGTAGTKVPIKRNRANGSKDDTADTTQAAQQGGDKVPVKKDAATTLAERIEKTLYDIGRVACIIDELKWVKEGVFIESFLEQDNSDLPQLAAKALDTLCEFLLKMVQEEVEEIMSNTDVQTEDFPLITIIANVAKDMNVDYRKALRRIEGLPEVFQDELSKANKKMSDEQMMHLQSAHDHVAALSGGEACNGNGDDDMGKLNSADKARAQVVHDHLGAMGASCKAAKAAFQTHSPLRKGLAELTDGDLTLENPNLPAPIVKLLGKTNGLEFQLGKLGTTVTDLVKEVKKLKDQPMPGKGVTRFTAISKGQDVGNGGVGDGVGGYSQLSPDDQAVVAAFNERLSKMGETERAKELIKLSLAQPVFRVE